jgi:hypothetical protein
MEAAMSNPNTHSSHAQTSFIGRLMERVYDICIESAMYRMAPTRKM